VEASRRELEDLRRLAARVAGEAAAYLRDRFGLESLLDVRAVHSYDTDESMVIDYESEENLIELLRAEGFRGLFVGEEHGAVRLGGDPYVAIVDPLDGSKNYASMVPWCSVSIAFAPIPQGREPRLIDVLAGAVAPILGLPVLSFARGLGAFEGGARVTRPPRRPRIVLTYVEAEEQATVLRHYLALSGPRSVRALGSASLEIAWAGMGRAEAFIDVRGRLRVVDVAAALWFAREAGGVAAVERPGASLARVERVGGVAVAYSGEAWGRLAEALRRNGHQGLASSTI
jgi:myo-inositol-1(or 4)-monophosphatase